MNKLLEPRSVEFSDYKAWFRQTNELFKRQWLITLTLGFVQLCAFFLIYKFILWFESSLLFTGGMEFLISIFMILLLPTLLNMRFFYTHLAYSSDFSLGKGPAVLWNSVQKRLYSLLVEFSIVFKHMLFLIVFFVLIFIGLTFFENMLSLESEVAEKNESILFEPYKTLIMIFILYGLSRFFGVSSSLSHKYPLLACMGLGKAEFNQVKVAKDEISELVLVLPMVTPTLVFGLLTLFCVKSGLGNSMPYMVLLIAIFTLAINIYVDFLGYVMCRDVYLGQTENQTEKAKETSAVPEAV